MKFGKSKEEAEKEPSRGGGGNAFMRYLKEGDNQIQLVDEQDKWVWYWEHYNPGGYPYPCTNERDTCPGCTSDNDRVKKASRKVAFNALSEYDGKMYLNVWKVPKSVAEKLENRGDRLKTVTDRPYWIKMWKKDNGFPDYDVEGMSQEQPEYDAEQWVDPEDLLAAAYEEAHGDSNKTKATTAKSNQASREADLSNKLGRAAIKKSPPKTEKKAPEPPEEVTEEWLRGLEFFDLVNFCKQNGFGEPQGDDVNEVVDWMLANA